MLVMSLAGLWSHMDLRTCSGVKLLSRWGNSGGIADLMEWPSKTETGPYHHRKTCFHAEFGFKMVKGGVLTHFWEHFARQKASCYSRGATESQENGNLRVVLRHQSNVKLLDAKEDSAADGCRDVKVRQCLSYYIPTYNRIGIQCYLVTFILFFSLLPMVDCVTNGQGLVLLKYSNRIRETQGIYKCAMRYSYNLSGLIECMQRLNIPSSSSSSYFTIFNHYWL
jgi:hypothetical protein